MILTPLQQLPKNGENWGKFIVVKGFKKLHKVQNIAQSGHTACNLTNFLNCLRGEGLERGRQLLSIL